MFDSFEPIFCFDREVETWERKVVAMLVIFFYAFSEDGDQKLGVISHFVYLLEED